MDILHDGAKELVQNESDSSSFIIFDTNKEIGGKLSEIGGRLDFPSITNELENEIKVLWRDPAIQDDVLHARIRTTGIVEIQFSPVGENKKNGEVYRLFDVVGQRIERRNWIHLFEGVIVVIFSATC